MGETGQRWAAAGVILAGLGGAFAYGKTQGELELMAEWMKSADRKLVNHESSIATNTKGIEHLQRIMQDFFIKWAKPREDAPHTPWSGKPMISP